MGFTRQEVERRYKSLPGVISVNPKDTDGRDRKCLESLYLVSWHFLTLSLPHSLLLVSYLRLQDNPNKWMTRREWNSEWNETGGSDGGMNERSLGRQLSLFWRRPRSLSLICFLFSYLPLILGFTIWKRKGDNMEKRRKQKGKGWPFLPSLASSLPRCLASSSLGMKVTRSTKEGEEHTA